MSFIYASGARDLRALAAFLGAAYDWGEYAGGDWVCSRTGTVATATGSPTVTTLGGRPAALFSGSQWFRTAAFAAALTQPYAQVIVARSDGDATAIRVALDGITGGNRASVAQDATTRRFFSHIAAVRL